MIYDVDEYNYARLNSDFPSDVGNVRDDYSIIYDNASATGLTWTPVSAETGNAKTWVRSFKFLNPIQDCCIFDLLNPGGSTATSFIYNYTGTHAGKWTVTDRNGTVQVFTPVQNDLSSYIHLHLTYDPDAIGNNQWVLTINGVVAPATGTAPGCQWGEVGYEHSHYKGYGAFGYMSAIASYDVDIDGSIVPVDQFGYFDNRGVWIPKMSYKGDFGNHGVYREYSDKSSVTNLIKDTRPLYGDQTANEWTPNNLSMTDQVKDTWSNNFCTWNPNDTSGSTLSNGNLTASVNANSAVRGSQYKKSGKWFFEIEVTSVSSGYIGLAGNTGPANGYTQYAFGANNSGDVFENNANSGFNTIALTNNSIYGIAYDVDAQLAWWSKDGQWYSSDSATVDTISAAMVSAGKRGYDFSGLGATEFSPHLGSSNNGGFNTTANFGQKEFVYGPPDTTFKPLSTTNLPLPAIPDGSKHFQVVTYTGNGASQSITGLGFQPDFVWIKERDNVGNNMLFDSLRGVGNLIVSDSSSIETNSTQSLQSFDSDGFTVGSDTDVNQSSTGYVAWCWKMGGPGVPNNDGTISTTVSVNTCAGMSIINYTGDGVDGATIGHGLGKEPDFCIIKKTLDNTAINTGNWILQHRKLSAGMNADDKVVTLTSYTNGSIYLNLTNGQSTYGFDNQINGNTDEFISYCFAGVEGFSRFDSYTGNGNANGPFIHCGFTPRYVMIKRIDVNGYGWQIYDTSRSPFNDVQRYVQANTSNAEVNNSVYAIQMLSNGFKIVSSDALLNANGGTYIYASFAKWSFGGKGLFPVGAQ